ncbi:hypothetical protein AKJ62_01385 [candidate division MSBL1 archaeon SCGC-AAA259D14]|uniref:Uncharacterized protein n=1 Tax=candidate division MSBL1 archaeon SCGC-AAA259D14 TaxID=1698261 RepID=A0A133U7P7_9EURY|nr:hypothetical protein AKJ62_01385 [candidate division MSBL1 archaeon SCGC-AAA259D14]
MTGRWCFICEDCKVEVVLRENEKFSPQKLNGLDGSKLQEFAGLIEELRELQKKPTGGETPLGRLGKLLDLLLEHHGHETRLYHGLQGIKTENLPWFERWSWREDITSLEPSPVAKDGWRRGLSLKDAVGESDDI